MELYGIFILGAFVLGIWLGLRDLRERHAREQGQICPVCKGTGRFRSWDTCIRCGGKGVL